MELKQMLLICVHLHFLMVMCGKNESNITEKVYHLFVKGAFSSQTYSIFTRQDLPINSIFFFIYYQSICNVRRLAI